MGFKENLRDEISYQGLLVKELAAKSGINAGTLSNYLRENSSVPSADVAVKIARALDVSVEYLVTGKKAVHTNGQSVYSAEVRLLADKISEMSARDRKLVASLVEAICG